MATKTVPVYALIEFNGRAIVMDVADAAAAFALLCRGEVVEYSWQDKVYKRITDASYLPMMKMFTTAQYAATTLSSDEN
jgi:hypothetical protein